MEVVNHLKIKKCHFVGLSLGSIVVRIIAKHNPKQVASMVLAGAVTRLNAKVSTLLALATTFKRIIPYSLIKKVIAKCIIPQEKYEKSKALFLRNAKKVSFDSFLNWLKLGDGVGRYIRELFDEYISIPTLYLMGEDDRLFLPQVQQTVRNSGDNVSMIVVPNAGHVCNVDNKGFFNRHSLEFLRNISLQYLFFEKSPLQMHLPRGVTALSYGFPERINCSTLMSFRFSGFTSYGLSERMTISATLPISRLPLSFSSE